MARYKTLLMTLGCLAALLDNAQTAEGRAGRGESYDSGTSRSSSGSNHSSGSSYDRSSRSKSSSSTSHDYSTRQLRVPLPTDGYTKRIPVSGASTRIVMQSDGRVTVSEVLQLDQVVLEKHLYGMGLLRELALEEIDLKIAPKILTFSHNLKSVSIYRTQLLLKIDHDKAVANPTVSFTYEMAMPLPPATGVPYVSHFQPTGASRASLSIVHPRNSAWPAPKVSLFNPNSSEYAPYVPVFDALSQTFSYALDRNSNGGVLLVQPFGKLNGKTIAASGQPWQSTRIEIDATIHQDESLSIRQRFTTVHVNSSLSGQLDLFHESYRAWDTEGTKGGRDELSAQHQYLLKNAPADVATKYGSYLPASMPFLLSETSKNKEGLATTANELRYDSLGQIYGKDTTLRAMIIVGNPFKNGSYGRTEEVVLNIELPDFLSPNDIQTHAFFVMGFPGRGSEQSPVPMKISTKGQTLTLRYEDIIPANVELAVVLDFAAKGFERPSGVSLAPWIWSTMNGFQRKIVIAVPCACAVLIFLFFALVRRIKRRDLAARKQDAINSGAARVSAEEMSRQLGEDFLESEFLERCRRMATEVQQAWSKGAMKEARYFLSQGLRARLDIQLRLMRETEGLKNLMSDFKVAKAFLRDITETGAFQTVDVEMQCCARDVTVALSDSDETVRSRLEQTASTPWSEVYSFTRRKGVKTKGHAIDGTCPNCGDGVKRLTDVNTCESCGIIFNSGHFDWILTEITQSSEWKARSNRARKASLHAQVIEDRASYLFWRYIEAAVRGISADFSRETQVTFEVSGSHVLKAPVVGAVELSRYEESAEVMDARINIKWSANLDGQGVHHYRSELHLAGPLAVLEQKGFSAPACKGCGAPLADMVSAVCSYCNVAIPEKVQDLLLVAFEPALLSVTKKAAA